MGAFVAALELLPIQPVLVPSRSVLVDVQRLAIEQNLSGYDATYLALAQALALPLGALDGSGKRMGLKQAAVAVGVELVDERMVASWHSAAP